MRTAVIIMAMFVAVPVLAQDVTCPIRAEPVALQGILFCNGVYSLRENLLILNSSTDGYNTAAEFDALDFLTGIQHVSLVIEVWNYGPGGDVGQIQVFNYIGDGVISTSDYWAGSFYTAMPMNEDGYRIPVMFDVTSAFSDAYIANEDYVGFRLSSIIDGYELYDVHLCVDDGTSTQAVSWGKIKGLAR